MPLESVPRHQCLIYARSPALHLPALATSIREHLDLNFRCLYLNSPQMVAGIRPYLEAAGVDVPHEISKGSLLLTSECAHLVNDRFEPGPMLQLLRAAVDAAVTDGYEGLWASGDMSWEFGPAQDYSKLMEYERALEEYFKTEPRLRGVCQYHADTLPADVVGKGLALHPGEYINATLSRINPHYRQ